MNVENLFFYFNFSNNDFSFTINSFSTNIFLVIKNICIQGRMSQNFDSGFCYFFMMLIYDVNFFSR